MKHLLDELMSFETAGSKKIVELSLNEEKVFRSLKTQGERAIRGRQIDRCVFEAKFHAGTSLVMMMEGRHAMSVANQVCKTFERLEDVDLAKVFKTKKGAYVVLKVR